MISLSTLKNTSRPKKKIQRIGRGIGSNRGKTSTRGGKGDTARSGYKTRSGYEGGQMPLYRKLPIRGFSNTRHRNFVKGISLDLINALFHDGETVNAVSLREKGLLNRKTEKSFKILAGGALQKKVKVDVALLSQNARNVLTEKKALA